MILFLRRCHSLCPLITTPFFAPKVQRRKPQGIAMGCLSYIILHPERVRSVFIAHRCLPHPFGVQAALILTSQGGVAAILALGCLARHLRCGMKGGGWTEGAPIVLPRHGLQVKHILSHRRCRARKRPMTISHRRLPHHVGCRACVPHIPGRRRCAPGPGLPCLAPSVRGELDADGRWCFPFAGVGLDNRFRLHTGFSTTVSARVPGGLDASVVQL